MASIYIEVIVIMDDGADQRILVAKTFHGNALHSRKPGPVFLRIRVVNGLYKLFIKRSICNPNVVHLLLRPHKE